VRTLLKSLIPKSYDFETKTLGEHILKRRLFLNMKQTEVAKLFNITHFTVGNWENGHAEPKFCQTPILIKFLGYDTVNNNPILIAEFLFAKRRELGWSQRMVAQNIGVDPCTWSSWECDGTVMIHKHWRLVASFLGIAEGKIVGNMKKTMK
jgi:transcriptional regulator with XRE-family HTH domain